MIIAKLEVHQPTPYTSGKDIPHSLSIWASLHCDGGSGGEASVSPFHSNPSDSILTDLLNTVKTAEESTI